MPDKPNILIVDDDESFRKILIQIFNRKGFATEAVGTGKEAIERSQTKFYNLALLDIKLPDMDGVDLLGRLKQIHPDMGMIMITGHASLDNAVDALNRGASAYMIKPLSMDHVLAIVHEALEKQRLIMENRRLFEEARHELLERKRAQEALKEAHHELEDRVLELAAREAELKNQKGELQELNNALTVLLNRRDHEKREFDERILTNVKELIEPYLEKLRHSRLDGDQAANLNILESNLKDIVSPLAKELSSDYYDLTPSEIQVANLIKIGKRTKDIAEILHLSQNTILSHRYKIRGKLGLLNNKINLRTFLQSLE